MSLLCQFTRTVRFKLESANLEWSSFWALQAYIKWLVASKSVRFKGMSSRREMLESELAAY